MLAIVLKAKMDATRRRGRPNLMYTKFKEDFGGRFHPSPIGLAEWVMDFMRKYGVKDACLSVKDKETGIEIKRAVKQNANL